MKKALRLFMIALVVFLFRYSLAIWFVNGPLKIDSDLEDQEFKILPSQVFERANIVVDTDTTDDPINVEIFNNIYQIPDTVSSSVTGIVNSEEFMYVVEYFFAAVFFAITLCHTKKLLESLWLFEDREYFTYVMLLFYPTAFVFSFEIKSAAFMMFSTMAFNLLFKKKYNKVALVVGLSVLANKLGLILLIPFFYYMFMQERYNQKFKLVPKFISYLIIAILPLSLYWLITLNPIAQPAPVMPSENKYMFIPFLYFFNYYQQFGFTLNFEYILSILIMLAFVILLIVEFVKLFLVFEYKTNEQNALFIYMAIFILLISSSSLSNDVVRDLGLCISSFILPAIVLNINFRSFKYLIGALVLASLQGLLFVNYLI